MPGDGQAALHRAHQKHDGDQNVLDRDCDEKHGDVGRHVVEFSKRLLDLRNARRTCIRYPVPQRIARSTCKARLDALEGVLALPDCILKALNLLLELLLALLRRS